MCFLHGGESYGKTEVSTKVQLDIMIGQLILRSRYGTYSCSG